VGALRTVAIKRLSIEEFRADRTIFLRHGEKMLFGKDNEKGIVLEGLKLKAVSDRSGWLYAG